VDRTAALDRGGRDPRGPRGGSQLPARNGWGSLQGGLGVCIIVAGAAVGAIVTMVTRSQPGFALGFFVVVGTIAAAFAVRPRAGRIIFPVPALSYLVAALVSGVIYDHTAAGSRSALALGAAQWVANGFFPMALATAAAVIIIVARWLTWRRRNTGRKPGPGTSRPSAGTSRPSPGSAARGRPAPPLFSGSATTAGARRPGTTR